jgi:hypothetical protein
VIILNPVVISLARTFAMRRVTLHLTRDGEQTGNLKIARLLTPDGLVLMAAFIFRNGHSESQLFLAADVDGTYLLLVTDEVEPKRAAARYPTISGDLTLSVDLNDGTGGAGGAPATIAARVQVDGLPAAREVLAVEMQPDGAWRIAGSLRTADGALDLRVTGGAVYTVAVDDYGVVYQPSLAVAVGVVIRPILFAGWLYRITEAGTLPAIEQAWWPAEGDNASRLLGTARAIAVRYYQPLAHGPLPVELL